MCTWKQHLKNYEFIIKWKSNYASLLPYLWGWTECSSLSIFFLGETSFDSLTLISGLGSNWEILIYSEHQGHDRQCKSLVWYYGDRIEIFIRNGCSADFSFGFVTFHFWKWVGWQVHINVTLKWYFRFYLATVAHGSWMHKQAVSSCVPFLHFTNQYSTYRALALCNGGPKSGMEINK